MRRRVAGCGTLRLFFALSTLLVFESGKLFARWQNAASLDAKAGDRLRCRRSGSEWSYGQVVEPGAAKDLASVRWEGTLDAESQPEEVNFSDFEVELLDPTGELLDGLAEARRADLAEATGGHEAVLFSLEDIQEELDAFRWLSAEVPELSGFKNPTKLAAMPMPPCPECRAISKSGSEREIFVDACCLICTETQRPFILLPCNHGMCKDCFQRWAGPPPAPSAPSAPSAPPLAPTGLANEEGAPVAPGRRSECRHLLYCGRNLGTAAIPGSDGRCGPGNGPQCQSCASFQRALIADLRMKNSEGATVFLGSETNKWYCGRRLGTAAIPGSDGRCGPSNGPQCRSCQELDASHLANDEGAPVCPGKVLGSWDGRRNLYCGRNLGRAAIPGSDGRCGPSAGPQCQSCLRYQIRFISDPWPL